MDLDMKQLAVAIRSIAEEKNLPEDSVKEVVEQALAPAYRRDYGDRQQRSARPEQIRQRCEEPGSDQSDERSTEQREAGEQRGTRSRVGDGTEREVADGGCPHAEALRDEERTLVVIGRPAAL